MKNYKTILFDLDGTLTDSGVGITNSVSYALEKLGIDALNKGELNKFIGPPLLNSFEKYYGFSEEQSKKAVEYYREYFKDIGIFENVVYDDVEKMLANLKNSGKTLVLATSKPEVFAKRILEHFNLSQYFSFIAGSNLDGTRTQKSEVISYALSSIKCDDLSNVVMVGDREHDIIGANAVSIDSIGVLFGYGSREELEAVSPTFIAEKVKDIENIIL